MSHVGNRIWRALIAGLGATIVLSICIYIKRWTGIVPQVNPIQALVRVSTLRLGTPLLPWIGWAEHFFIGTILWGVAFAILVPWLKGPRWLRGIEFAIGAWILMMVLLMPPAGDGWFAAYLGYGAPLAARRSRVAHHLRFQLGRLLRSACRHHHSARSAAAREPVSGFALT